MEKGNFEEKVLEIKRVAKKTKGGNTISFTALVVVGNGEDSFGIGKGKALDVNSAIQKAMAAARNNVSKINLVGGTIPHEVATKFKSVKVTLKPAPKGAGVIAGGAVRVVCDLAGVKDISAKIIGSGNKEVGAIAASRALGMLRSEVEMKGRFTK